MGSHHLNLKWRNHHSNLLTVFSQLLTNEAFADVTLACDGASLRAHKLILSACSPFFHSLFAQHPCQHPIVILKDVPFEDLKVLVDFMYHGEVNIAQERLPSFLRTAEALKVKGLSESEAHNRIGPIKPLNATSNSHQKTSSEKRFASGSGGPKPACKKNKRSENQNQQESGSALSLPRPLGSTGNDNSSPTHEPNIHADMVETKLEEGTPTPNEVNDDSHEEMPSLEAEQANDGTDKAISGSMLQMLPQTSDASSSDNILEVESYRQLQRMASLLAFGGTSSPVRQHLGMTLPPGYSGRLGAHDDEDDDEDDDKDSSEQGKADEGDETNPVNEDVHALTKLPRHKKKDCIVCGNRAAGLRRRSRQWCPGCNVGVHVHCFEKLVHYRRHPRRSRSDANMMPQISIPFATAYTKIT